MAMWRYGVAVGVLASLGACSDMSHMMGHNTQSARPAAAATQPTVAPEMVKQVQSKLRDDGYYKQGAVDGVWGLGTENAVRAYQRDHNLGSSGQLDVATLRSLNVTNTSVNGTNPTQPASNTNPPANNNPNYQPEANNPNSPPPNTNPNAAPADNTAPQPTH